MPNLGAKAAISIAVLALVMGLLLFIPAGTLRYWQAWNYLVLFFAASAFLTIYLARRDPALLARRLSGGPTSEKETSQRIIMALVTVGFLGLLIVPGLDFRFKWSSVPLSLIALGDILTIVGFYVIYLVYRENSFGAATIQVMEGQKVISTGPYAVVRHPMYAGGLLYLVVTPLTLGSYWGFVPLVIIIPAIVWRLLDEERFLGKNLPGYDDYRARLPWRLIPGVY
jgi:protein-S-isoprenylcysteine O-methyltransferase Ste14